MIKQDCQRRSCFDVEFMKLWVKRCYKRAFFGFIVCRLPMRFCLAIAMSGAYLILRSWLEQRALLAAGSCRTFVGMAGGDCHGDFN